MCLDEESGEILVMEEENFGLERGEKWGVPTSLKKRREWIL